MGREGTAGRFLAAALLVLTPSLGSAQTLSGRLLDEGTDGPIDLGRVVLVDVLVELMPGESLDAAVPKREIEAIEVYRAPFGPPLRYLRDFDPVKSCGAVLIWTNRR